MALSDSLSDLDPKIARALESAIRGLRQELFERIESTRRELGLGAAGAPTMAAGEGRSLEALANAVGRIDRATTQTELLTATLEGAGSFASRTVFLVAEGAAFTGWAGYGFAGRDEQIASLRVDAGAGGWKRCRAGEGVVRLDDAESARLTDTVGAHAAAEGVLVPFTLRGDVAGALYADRAAGDEPLGLLGLQLLVYAASNALETLPLRGATGSSTLQIATEGAAAAEPAFQPSQIVRDVEEAEGAAPEPEPSWQMEDAAPAPEPEPEPFAAAPEPEPEPFAGAPEPEPEPEIEIEPEPAPAEEPVPAETVAFDASLLEDTEPAPAETVAYDAGRMQTLETAAPEPAEETEEIEEAAPEPAPAPPSFSETVAIDSAIAADETQPAPAPPTPRRGAEIAPPKDLEGPGWAFSSAAASGQDTQHEEARRLARLLVTEIKLYNEEKVEESREHGNIYAALQEDIDRSRKIFDERVDEEVRAETDYFYEELVRILADGDSTALGM